MPATREQCLEEIEMFFDAVGAVPDDNEYDYPEKTRCIVCGRQSEFGSYCEASCYEMQKYTDRARAEDDAHFFGGF